MRALHIPPNTPTPIPTKLLHAFVLVSSFGLSTPFRTFHDALLAAREQAATCDGVHATEPDHYVCYAASRGHNDRLRILAILLSLRGGPATEQAATCDWVYATELDHYGCHVAGRGHSDHCCILAVILSLCGGPATEQANKSGGTLATIQSIRDSAEESHIVVKDEHHCCRALLFASHAIVRSGSNGQQRWQPWPKQCSPNIRCKLHRQTATDHLATLLFDSISPI